MTLSDKMAMRQVIGCLMLNPLLFLEYPDISSTDFDDKAVRACFVIIKKLYDEGAQKITPIEVDLEIEKLGGLCAQVYKTGNGLDILNSAYEFAEITNFKLYYTRLKKYSLLQTLQKNKYDISEFYIADKDVTDPIKEAAIQAHLDESSLEDILNAVESKYTIIRNDYLGGGKSENNPAEGINELIEELRLVPSIGPDLEGAIFNTACRGAREGCFYLKSASSGAGKTRTSVFDACKLCYPKRWSHELNTFITEVTRDGMPREPRKVLFIVTEMDLQEIQTIILAYLSGVNEEHIIIGNYELGEYSRVQYAAKIMQEYEDYFVIEAISDPNLNNIEATIKKYAIINKIKYVIFDYIHTTASMMSQFAKSGLREDVVLMLMANQLKQLAKDYNLFIFSATQVNMGAMSDDGEFKNEMNIRGSKACADKCDMGYVITRVSDRFWNNLLPSLQQAVREGRVSEETIIRNKPTHVLDIYKMRRGRYKNVRIWTYIDLGTGYRKDLFITTADNQPLGTHIDIFSSIVETPIEWKGNVND